jgi:hypothetical protein
VTTYTKNRVALISNVNVMIANAFARRRSGSECAVIGSIGPRHTAITARRWRWVSEETFGLAGFSSALNHQMSFS